VDLAVAIDTARAELADLLAELSPEEWEKASLCEGWRVREVAAHVALTTTPPHVAALEMARAGFRFNAMIDRTARAHAAAPTDQLVDEVRGLVGARRRPPGTVPADPLNDVLIHTQDIARPLGRTVPVSPAAGVVAADLVWGRTFPFGARRRVAGYALVATDAEWERGSGTRVEAPIGELLLMMTGRLSAAAV
jgi:uncharacterized protein (TIGR03083 family)